MIRIIILAILLQSWDVVGGESIMAQSVIQETDLECQIITEESSSGRGVGRVAEVRLAVRQSGVHFGQDVYPYDQDNLERDPMYPEIGQRKRARTSPDSLVLTSVVSGSASESVMIWTVSRVSLSIKFQLQRDNFDRESIDYSESGSGTCKVVPKQQNRF